MFSSLTTFEEFPLFWGYYSWSKLWKSHWSQEEKMYCYVKSDLTSIINTVLIPKDLPFLCYNPILSDLTFMKNFLFIDFTLSVISF